MLLGRYIVFNRGTAGNRLFSLRQSLLVRLRILSRLAKHDNANIEHLL